ncbi:hypothetical protein OIU79_008439 [Salix purpurea]|uniref:Uncharacterized protein n=1 Tax=Salix purpurea TaxID=77065 RepID=A0A9Q0TID8_SALPP|nr:hypothetical protein OIU79_008439 [Salix purpurea]
MKDASGQWRKLLSSTTILLLKASRRTPFLLSSGAAGLICKKCFPDGVGPCLKLFGLCSLAALGTGRLASTLINKRNIYDAFRREAMPLSISKQQITRDNDI